MSRVGGSFPHPVLGHGDDLTSRFELYDVRQVSTLDHVQCTFKVILDDPDMHALIERDQVHLLAVWNCNGTLQRGLVTPELVTEMTTSRMYRFRIDQDLVFGRIDVVVQLIAKDSISNYKPTRRNREYGDFAFAIEAGDVVGIAGSFVLDAHKLYDPMQPPVDSCFRIVRSLEVNDPMDFRLDLASPEYIRIELSQEAFEGFLGLGSHPDLQVSMVVFPALVAVLAEMKSDSEGDLVDSTWFKSLARLIMSAGVQDADVLTQAQTLLPTPALKGMRAYAEGEGESLD